MTSEISLTEVARIIGMLALQRAGAVADYCTEPGDEHCTLLRGNLTTTLHHSLTSKSYDGKVISELQNETWSLIEKRLWAYLNAQFRAAGRPQKPGVNFGPETRIEASGGKTLFPLFWALERLANPPEATQASAVFDSWLNLTVEDRLWLARMGCDDEPGTRWRLACWVGLADAR